MGLWAQNPAAFKALPRCTTVTSNLFDLTLQQALLQTATAKLPHDIVMRQDVLRTETKLQQDGCVEANPIYMNDGNVRGEGLQCC